MGNESANQPLTGRVSPASAAERESALVSLVKSSASEDDVSSLALVAAQTVATVCHATFYAVTERNLIDGQLRRRFVRLLPDFEADDGLDEATHELSERPDESLPGFAMRTGQALLVPKLAGEPRFTDVDLAQAEIVTGLEGPFGQPPECFGSLGIYGVARPPFSSTDLRFLESICPLMGLAFARQKAELLVDEQAKRLAAIDQSNAAPLLELGRDALVIRCNPAAEALTGFTASELSDRSFFSAFILPEESDAVMQSVRRVQRGKERVRFECTLLTKAGSRRRVVWTCTRLDNFDSSMLLIGVDITDHHQALERVHRAEAAAGNAQRALKAMQQKASRLQRGLTEPTESRVERRRQSRIPYKYVQRLAPMICNDLPAMEDFDKVVCKDLSSHGFSFRSTIIPDFQRVVMAFGKGRSIIYVTAEIVHVTPEGSEYIVGCRYTGRAQY